MKSFLLGIIVFFSACHSSSQGLSLERVKKIKAATVRVIVGNGESTGTGFFLDKSGIVVTCWHVIGPALIQNSLINYKNIKIEFPNGDTVQMRLSDNMKFRGNETEFAYDYCLLYPAVPLTREVSFLKLGNFNSLNEGQEVYTCGYPLGYPQQFISKGIVSTKYLLDSILVITNGKKSFFHRDQALIDITLNRGNSGGAILTIGSTPDDDRVIGIADFIVNPLGDNAYKIIENSQAGIGAFEFSTTDSSGRKTSSNDPMKSATIYAEAISSLSIGVSGCISVSYLRDAFLGLK